MSDVAAYSEGWSPAGGWDPTFADGQGEDEIRLGVSSIIPYPTMITAMIVNSDEESSGHHRRLRVLANAVTKVALAEEMLMLTKAVIAGTSVRVEHNSEVVNLLARVPSSLGRSPRPVIGLLVAFSLDHDVDLIPQLAAVSRGFTATHGPGAMLIAVPPSFVTMALKAWPTGTADTWMSTYWAFVVRQAKTPTIDDMRWWGTALAGLQALGNSGGATTGFKTEKEEIQLLIDASNAIHSHLQANRQA